MQGGNNKKKSRKRWLITKGNEGWKMALKVDQEGAKIDQENLRERERAERDKRRKEQRENASTRRREESLRKMLIPLK